MPLRLIASLCALLLLTPGARAAEDSPTVMILLDGSGSMWGRLAGEDRAKFEAARDALRQNLTRIRPDVRLGLASFGHRRRGNCSDAEVIVPPEPNSLERIMPPLERLNATGKGPLVLGLREAATAIGTAAPASIVLIHDDVDNCGQDLCAAAADIVKASPNLTVHTISIGLDRPRLQQMSCLASLTGGKLYDVQDGAGIATALDRIIKLANLEPGAQTAAEEGAAEGAKSKLPKDAPPGLYLSAGLGPESATLESPVRWRVSKAGEGGELIREAKAPTLTEKLPPGTYDIEARLGLAAARQTVDVSADAPTPVRINLNAGVLKMLARATKGAPPLQTPVFTVTVLDGEGKPVGTPLWIGREAQPEIVLPAGDYRVRAEDGLARQEQIVKIAAATGTTFDAMLATGRLQLVATRGDASDQKNLMTDGVTFLVHEDDPDAQLGRREVARSGAPSPIFTLPAGTYYVTARAAGAEAREQIAIGAGDAVKRLLPLALGRLELSATLDGAPAPDDLPVTFNVIRLDDEPREVLRTVEREPKIELSAGRYRIEATLGTTNVRAAAEVTLAAGQSQKVGLKLQAAHVTLRLAAGQAASAADIFWEIKDEGRHTVLRTSQMQPTALLAPGRYIVTTETGYRPLRSSIELKPGEHHTFEVGG